MESNKVANKGSCGGKLFVLGLFAVVCFLLLALHREQKAKEGVVKRKSVLHDKLEAAINREKEADKMLKEMGLQLGEQRKQIEAQKKESGELQRKLDTLTKSYEQKVGDLGTLQKNTNKIQENLDALKKENELVKKQYVHLKNQTTAIASSNA